MATKEQEPAEAFVQVIDPAAPTMEEVVGGAVESAEEPAAQSETKVAGPRRILRELAEVRTAALVVIALLLICFAMYFSRPILLPLAMAVILNFLLSPFVRACERIRIPPSISARLAILLTATALVYGGMRLSQPASMWLNEGPSSMRLLETKLRSLRQPIQELSKASAKVEKLTEGAEDPEVLKVQVKQNTFSDIVMDTTKSFLVGAFLAVVVLYFMLAAGDRSLGKMVELMPTFKDKRNVVEMARSIEQGISVYLVTVTVINICLGVIMGLAMWLIGLPNPALWGVMATFLNFIPFAGALVGAGVVFLVSLVSGGSLSEAMIAPLVYMVINGLEGNFITPSILGRRMSMSPLAVLLALTFWGWMWGVGGALLAVPMLAMFKIFCDHVEHLQPVALFIEE